ncbi:MAG: ribosomal L7Ae/L30e/S12e/Gadd45 family protein [Christensenellales bacterium]|jgi:ribosomal protein L7Ae-like RNA K-turn-binding protein
MDERQLKGSLGLAYKAGQLIPGADKALMALREGKAALMLLDQGTAVNTRKKLADGCAYRGVTLLELPEGLLGQAIGRPGVNAAAMTAGGMAGKIQQTITGGEKNSAAKNILEDTRLHG